MCPTDASAMVGAVVAADATGELRWIDKPSILNVVDPTAMVITWCSRAVAGVGDDEVFGSVVGAYMQLARVVRSQTLPNVFYVRFSVRLADMYVTFQSLEEYDLLEAETLH